VAAPDDAALVQRALAIAGPTAGLVAAARAALHDLSLHTRAKVVRDLAAWDGAKPAAKAAEVVEALEHAGLVSTEPDMARLAAKFERISAKIRIDRDLLDTTNTETLGTVNKRLREHAATLARAALRAVGYQRADRALDHV
jgi:hypothetical protein